LYLEHNLEDRYKRQGEEEKKSGTMVGGGVGNVKKLEGEEGN
jgi:hypothetical protein